MHASRSTQLLFEMILYLCFTKLHDFEVIKIALTLETWEGSGVILMPIKGVGW